MLFYFLFFYFNIGYLCYHHKCFATSIIFEYFGYRFYTCEIKDIALNDDGIFEKRIVSCNKLNKNINRTIYLKTINNEFKLDAEKY